jgi:hypothetical protein
MKKMERPEITEAINPARKIYRREIQIPTEMKQTTNFLCQKVFSTAGAGMSQQRKTLPERTVESAEAAVGRRDCKSQVSKSRL